MIRHLDRLTALRLAQGLVRTILPCIHNFILFGLRTTESIATEMRAARITVDGVYHSNVAPAPEFRVK